VERETYYDRLGVAPTATAADIRSAYRDLARALHPDRANGSPSPRMAAVNEAWSVLGDPARRAEYDATLARERAMRARPARPAPRPAPRPTRDGAGHVGEDVGEDVGEVGDDGEDDWRLDVPITDGRAVRTLGILVAVTGALAAIAVAALFAYAILR
jgi:curved DNA-binding protein CbpA